MRRRLASIVGAIMGVLGLFVAVALAGAALPAPRVLAAEVGADPVPLTLAEAARLALQQGPQRQDIALSAARAKAGADLAESAFRWHVTVGTARIPQLVELAEQLGSPPKPATIVSPGTTGLVYDPVMGHRWAVLPAVSAAKAFPSGGQLVLTTHWGLFGPLDSDSPQRDQRSEWQPFEKMPLIQFTQPLFRDPGTLEPVLRREEARRNLERDRATARLTETRTLLELAQAYFAVAQAQDEVEMATRGLSRAQTEARVRQDKAWKGDATGLDLMEADILAQREAARVAAARHALDLARQRLNQLVGRPLTEPVVLAPPTVPPAPGGSPSGSPALAAQPGPEVAAAVAEALAYRPEIILAQSAIESARAQLAAARAAAGTQVSASAGVAKDRSWIAGLDVQWPLWDGGTGRAQVEQAAAGLALAEQALVDRREEITLEVTQAYYARQDAARAYDVADLAVRQASEAVRLARDRLAKGSAVAREVEAAEDALFAAEAARRAALYRWYQTEWSWQAALGRLVQE
ncbi:MAG: TolC family protein [Betaproteobacteria bacterium]